MSEFGDKVEVGAKKTAEFAGKELSAAEVWVSQHQAFSAGAALGVIVGFIVGFLLGRAF